MQKLVISYKAIGDKEAKVLYFGPDGEAAKAAITDATKVKAGAKAPALVELHQLGRATKRVFDSQPTKAELDNAKRRDATEAKRQKALKKSKAAPAKAPAAKSEPDSDESQSTE